MRRIRVIERPCLRGLESIARMLDGLDRFNQASSLVHAPTPFVRFRHQFGAVYCILSSMYLAFDQTSSAQRFRPFVYRSSGSATMSRCSSVVTQVVHLIIPRWYDISMVLSMSEGRRGLTVLASRRARFCSVLVHDAGNGDGNTRFTLYIRFLRHDIEMTSHAPGTEVSCVNMGIVCVHKTRNVLACRWTSQLGCNHHLVVPLVFSP